MQNNKMCASKLSEFLDGIVNAKRGKMFIFKAKKDEKTMKKLKKINQILQKTIVEIRTRNLKGSICRSSCALYEALVYKFGVSNRHQKFWRNALQIYRELKKLNKQDILEPFIKFTKGLEKSNFHYPPTKNAIRFLGALILRRILFLDKLRLICAQSADCSMGYIELRHFLTFNLMSIAIASDVAHEALRQIQQLVIIYAQLGRRFKRSSKYFPSSAKMLKFKSILDDELQRDGRNEYKNLKEHDLALLRREIDEISSNEPLKPAEQFISPISAAVGKDVQNGLLKKGRRNIFRVKKK